MSIPDQSRPAASQRRRRSAMPSARLDRVQRRGAGSLSKDGGRGERTPAVAERRHPPPGGGRVAADPDRRMRLADRTRMGGDAPGGEVPSLERVVVGGPDAADHLERLLEQRRPFVEFDAERGEFPFQVADADGECEPATGKQVERRTGLRDDERVAVGQHDDVGDQAQRRGPRRGETHRHERIDRIVAAGLQPPLGRRRMVGEPEPVKPGRLRRRRHGRDPRPVTSSGL